MYRPDPESRVKRQTQNMEGDARRQLFHRPSDGSRPPSSTMHHEPPYGTPLRFHRSREVGHRVDKKLDIVSQAFQENEIDMARRKQKELIRNASVIIVGDPKDAVLPETPIELPEHVLEEEQRKKDLQKVLDKAMSKDVEVVKNDSQLVEILKASLLEEVKQLDELKWIDEQCAD